MPKKSSFLDSVLSVAQRKQAEEDARLNKRDRIVKTFFDAFSEIEGAITLSGRTLSVSSRAVTLDRIRIQVQDQDSDCEVVNGLGQFRVEVSCEKIWVHIGSETITRNISGGAAGSIKEILEHASTRLGSIIDLKATQAALDSRRESLETFEGL